MQKRTLKVALLAVLAVVLVLGMSATAFADQTWSDLPDTVTAKYGVTDNQVAAISEGYPNGLWKPYQPVTRAQFTKMAVAAFNIPLQDPAVPSFTDVPKGDIFYKYVEGAKAAGIINGTTATTFSPKANITRQQALAIVARYVAKAQGYDLASMYTAEEIDHILTSHFGDAASISAELKAEMAFAFDLGITKGNNYGNLDPLANLTRIQGAAVLIRAQGLVPPNMYVPAKIELVSADKTENLIGVARQATFQVTDAAGHPAIGVLVDFDELTSGLYMVGNIDQQAAVTNSYGQVTVNMISTEPGTQRMSASVAGVGTVYTTAYWVALDEVYITDPTREAENNAGETHTWSARVVVMGPGPYSTSVEDWYNAVTTGTVDPTDLDATDGVDATCDLAGSYWDEPWDYTFETQLLSMWDLKPRTLPGINVNWSIVKYAVVNTSGVTVEPSSYIDPVNYGPLAGGNYVELYNPDDTYGNWSYPVTSVKFGTKSAPFVNRYGDLYVRVPAVTVPKVVTITVTDAEGTHTVGPYQYVDTVTLYDSVGDIVAVDGTSITPAKSAVGVTNAEGLSSITIKSEQTGKTKVQAIADYAGNPYPKQLFYHDTFQTAYGWHDYDWTDQPSDYATALKTWIPHVIGGDENVPITAASYVDNCGEVEKFTLTLKDEYGNVIPGYTVLWWIQGVGEFKTDDSAWAGVGEQNKDVDITDANGQSEVWVTSNEPGQTILHCKVVDKYGMPYKEWNVVKQWYRIDDFSFLPTTDPDGEPIPAVNLVGTTHTFTVQASGLKYVHVLYDLNQNGLMDDQALLGDRTQLKNLEGYLVEFDGELGAEKPAGVDLTPGAVLAIEDVFGKGYLYFTRYADYTLGTGEFMAPAGFTYTGQRDPTPTPVLAVWKVLPGKNVWFYNNIAQMELGDNDQWQVVDGTISNSSYPVDTSMGYPYYVGTITSPTTMPVVTDEKGQASVTITSNQKGYQFVFAVVDYPRNILDGDPTTPEDWQELLYDFAVKTWVVGGEISPSIVTFSTAEAGYLEGTRFTNWIDDAFTGYEVDGEAVTGDGDVQAYEETQATGTDVTYNPNYDIIGVAVFDQYGNALPGYRVQFELLDMGETDEGTIDTYHPYAHFSSYGATSYGDDVFYVDEAGYAEDYGLTTDWGHSKDDADAEYAGKLPAGNLDGVYDRNRNVDANPYWDRTEYAEDYGRYDDDKVVGYTLDGEINGNYTLGCAAYAVLVLDQTAEELGGYDHVTNRINVQVWSPAGALVDEYEITKVWSDETPEPTTLVLLMSKTGDDGTYVPGPLTTGVSPIYLMCLVYDQYGNLIDPTYDLMVKVTRTTDTEYLNLTDDGTNPDEGVYQIEYEPYGDGTYKLTPFVDEDGSGTLSAGELKGATRTLNWND